MGTRDQTVPQMASNQQYNQHTQTPPIMGKWTTFAIVGAGVFMATLDSSIVNISLPAIARYFQTPLNGTIEWIIIAYLIVTAATLLTIGRLADMLGRKPIWATGLVVFVIGSALSGASPSLGFLIAARAFQGLGGALLMAISPAILTSAFLPQERGKALGLNAVTVSLGVSAGPTLGGIITQSLSWRWIFFVNVPIGIIAFIATIRFLRDSSTTGYRKFDPIGAIALAIGLAMLTLGLSFGQEWGWLSGKLIGSMIVSLSAFVILVLTEQRVTHPLLDFSLLRNRVFASANLTLLLSFLALFAVSFLMPFYLEELRGFSIITAGLFLTPLPLTIAVIAPFSGNMADRFGTQWLASIGLGIACLGLFFISQLTAQSTTFDIIWRLVFTGIGQGLFQSPNNSALMGAAPRHRQGLAAGFLATGRVVGQSISVALAGAIFTSLGGATAGALLVANSAAHGHLHINVAAEQQTFQTGFHTAFIACMVIAAVGVFTALVRGAEQNTSS